MAASTALFLLFGHLIDDQQIFNSLS